MNSRDDTADRMDACYGPPFPAAEYDRRLAATRRAMADRGIDVLLVTDPANMNYLTGYDAWSFYVHQLLLVETDGAPYWVGRASDTNGVGLTTYLPGDNVIGYPEECVENVDRHAMHFVADLLLSRGHRHARVGVEMEAYYYTARAHQCLMAGLPDASEVDATGLVNRVRMVKTAGEIELLREAASIAELAMATAVENIEPDLRQNDAVAEIYRTQIRGTPEFGGDYTAIAPILPTGIGTSAPHLMWSDRRFRKGEATIIEIAGCRRRYHCPLARTVFLGTPPSKILDTEKAVIEGVAASLEAAKPGVLAEEVETVWRRSVARWGVVKESRLGYSIGINYPPEWGEHSVSLRPGDRTELVPGMAFHLMPGLWYDDWGIEISQPFLVGERGAEPLTRYPRRLVVKN